jgi:hypothetical protein
MEEAAENGKELSHCACGNGMNECDFYFKFLTCSVFLLVRFANQQNLRPSLGITQGYLQYGTRDVF